MTEHDDLQANSNFAPVARPAVLVRRDPQEAAKIMRERFKETLDILAGKETK